MSGFSGRRAPNVSQYLHELNAVPPTPELASRQEGYGSSLDEELAMFTNTQFFDFDMGENPDITPLEFDPTREERVRRENAAAHRASTRGIDYMTREYPYQNYPNYNVLDDSTLPPTLQTGPFPPHAVAQTPSSSLASPHPNDGSPTSVDQSSNGKLEDTTRHAAEEDKRRRNTAASARFRVKKKQREQTLERTAKEMSERAAQLEARINQLETENKWLKNLITEKNENKDDVADLWKKFSRGENNNNNNTSSGSSGSGGSTKTIGERKAGERTDGVGTLKFSAD
ncbi:MAG: hypothetical protein M1825_006005 [Sarcosagium campestre]|nr:MAG: hypothetical protein M1825_006005 [Sarcosagium campestre]